MYKTLAVFDGILIAFMVSFNGLLGFQLGNGPSLVIIHAVGLLGTLLLFLASRASFKSIRGLPVYLFMAGALGIFNVLFNNLSFTALGAALTLSLNLVGQLLTSMLLDHFGLLGLVQNRINKMKLIGIAVMILGIFLMMF